MSPAVMPATDARMLNAALRYAAHGWPVFPLHSIRNDGRCTCSDPDECGTNAGKHPRTEHGLHDATVDEAQICKWWRRWPNANIGVPTGAASGLMVLDIDPRHGGSESLEVLLRKFGPLPNTLEQLTGGDGRHIVLKHPGGHIPSRALPGAIGIDVKADGGYIVVAPSLHRSGKRYAWQ
jgi:hypothetical protein